MVFYLHSDHIFEADAFFRNLLQSIAIRLEYYVFWIFIVLHYKVERVLAYLPTNGLHSTHSYVVEKSIKSL